MRVLITDDNALVRSGIGEIISDRAWEVCGEACDGAEALEKARTLKPDVVLLDVSLPGTNGFTIARIIRENMPNIRIIMISYNALDQLLGKPDRDLADGFVDKSRLGTDLIPALSNLFGDA
jgi:DNA-binding NarL/FixJ family response regulator